MRILLTDGGHKNTLSIIRHLGRKKNEIFILHHKKSAPAYSRYCKRLFISPEISDGTNYINFVIDLISKNHFDVVIPVGAKAVSLFSQNKDNLKKNTSIAIPEFETINVALDKNQTYKLAEKLQIPHPITIFPRDKNQLDKMIKTIRFPIILKSPDESICKFSTIYVDLPTDFDRCFDKVIKLLKGRMPVIQEKIEGDGYGFYAVYNKGKCEHYFMHQRIREIPVNGGSSTCAKSYYNETLLAQGLKILDYLKWHGPAMVEFKKDIITNEFKLIEINPKLWGSLDLSMVAGINFPEIICQIALNKPITQSQFYNQNISFQWLFSGGGECYRLKEKPGDIFVVLKDLFKLSCKNDFWFVDIKPNLKQIVDFILSFFIKENG